MDSPPKNQDSSQNGYKWRAIGIVIIGTFMAILDSSIVNVALPHMMASFGTDIERIKWVATGYMIAYGIVVLTSDYLGRRMGHERLYVAALALFTIGSFFCGRAWDINSMIVFRAFQAVGGGLMLPTGMTIMTKAFKPQERGTAFGVFGLVILLAPVAGPTLGGYIVDKLHWQWIFLVNIPVGIAATPLAMIILRFEKTDEPVGFDWPGFLGLGTFLTALLIALSQGERLGWESPPIVLCFASAVIGLYVFLVADLYSPYPIIDLSLFSNADFSILFTASFFRAVALFGRTLFLSLFMQVLMGYSALSAGIYLIPGAIVAGVCTPVFGKLSDRIGSKFLIITGLAISALSMWLYRSLSINSSYDEIFWPMILFGLGMGMASPPIMSSMMNAVPTKRLGMASILQTVVMQVGGAYGINYLDALITARMTFHLQNQVEAFTGSIYNGARRWIYMPGPMQDHGPAAVQQLQTFLYHQGTASAWAYDDAFVILTILSIVAVILVCFYSGHPHPSHRVEKKADGHGATVEIG